MVLPCCNDRVGRSEGNVAVEDRKVFKTELEMVPNVGTKEDRQYLDVTCIIYLVWSLVIAKSGRLTWGTCSGGQESAPTPPSYSV